MTPPPPPRRARLDVLLVERGLAPTRQKAQALVLAGLVSSAGRRLDKPGASIETEAPLEVGPGRRFVGRGAGKLGPALDRFEVDPEGRDALDVGASTGGFTQVLLERGARRVIALDVGHGQLDWTLRNDARVIPVEGVNVRYLEDGGRQIGHEAAAVQADDPEHTIVSVKRLMGRSLADVQGPAKLPYRFVDHPGMVAIQTRQGEKTPVEVSAEILATLRQRA